MFRAHCFAGHDKDGKPWPPTWEPPQNIDDRLIHEFEDPPEPPKVPFVLTQPNTISARGRCD